MKTSGIYKIQSIANPDRCYIGSASVIKNRWSYHINALRSNGHCNKKLQNHFNKYGESDLVFSVLLGCEKQLLIPNEQFFIDSYNPYFNICKTAGNVLGRICSDETKKKISESNMGRYGPNTGKKMSKEFCQNVSKRMKGCVGSNKGKKFSDSIKEKMSNSSKEFCKTEKGKELIKKLTVLSSNRTMPETARIKISEAQKGNTNMLGHKHSEASKIKIGRKGELNHNYGKSLSEETKRKMSAAHMGMRSKS